MTEKAWRGQDICERTRMFALRVIKLHQAVSKTGTGQVLGKQLLRAGTSIGANVEEAQAGQSTPDFVHKMSIALKEARETRYWLTLLAESGLIPAARLEPLRHEADELIKILYTIIRNTKALDN
ncbi:MAG: four helix bundle protein [Caldilineae bacterium]|nr:MAG: four helix bundle protein [Caldilineae bacterium]